MGHLAIVNEATLQDVLRTGQVATTGQLGRFWKKTLADLLSDVLTARTGDVVFSWVVADKSSGSAGVGFGTQFEVAGKALFVPGADYPLVLQVDRQAIRWSPPLDESAALDLFGRELLWNAIGKKALGRGRSLTHQTLCEDRALVNAISTRSTVTAENVKVGRVIPVGAVPLKMSLKEERVGKEKQPRRLGDVDVTAVRWVRDGQFGYEKALEAWLCENIDQRAARGLWNVLEETPQDILWFGNYLSYGVQGSSIDFVVLHKPKRPRGRIRCTVIELKKDAISISGYYRAAEQVSRYGVFICRALASYGQRPSMRLVVLSASPKAVRAATLRRVNIDSNSRQTPVLWVGYSVVSESRVEFRSVL